MTKILISNRAQRDFAMVPNAIWRSDLSFAAKGVACYLFSLRDGSMPYVAEMEQALGLGRDARRKAFSALEAFGFISWQVERNARGAIVAKTLILDGDVFHRAPESQAHGESHHAPENPAGGFPVPARAENRPCKGGLSGDTLRKDKNKRARDAASVARSSSSVRPASAVSQTISGSSVPDRTAVAASLGLPVFHKASGSWLRLGSQDALNNGGGHA